MGTHLQIAVAPFTQDVSVGGYHKQLVKAEGGLAQFHIAPKIKVNYLSSVRHIKITDALEVINKMFLYRNDMHIFSDHYGLVEPSVNYESISNDEANMTMRKAVYPIDIHESFMRVYLEAIKRILETATPSTYLLNKNCEFSDYPFELAGKNLLGYIAADLAARISSGSKFKQCEECNIWFEVTDKRAMRARFCSTRCRVAAHRGPQ